MGPHMTDTRYIARPSQDQIAALRAGGIFDEAWYINEYPDVRKSGMDPAEHYLWFGQRIGRHPSKRQHEIAKGIGLSWCIIATPHVLFIAHTLADGLRRHGWSVEIELSMPDHFSHDFYIVLCAQMFDRLPPGEKRIIYQLEQSASSRWFSDSYIHSMENSFAVLDYSTQNMAYLASKGLAYPHVYYLPIGASTSYRGEISYIDRDVDILFYGDYKSSPRRQHLLEAAEKHFNVRRADSLFGDDIKRLIARSKFVLNLHYYEGAQLETPRIQECISLGTPVISESTSDQSDYNDFDGAVHFFAAGDADAMLAAIRTVQRDSADPAEKTAPAVKLWTQRHSFMLDRFLIGAGILPSSALGKMAPFAIKEGDVVALSLPETTERRQAFNIETRTPEMLVFDGIRRKPGWIGCGMSYKFLCQNALRQGVRQFAIVEDDALLSPDHTLTMKVIRDFLEAHEGEWDIFSGVIANLHEDTRVLNVKQCNGLDFITIDKMTSMIFNIYAEKAIIKIAEWDQSNVDTDNNTIDRYLEHAGLRIVTTDPFIVGHREELHSTLWGFQNTQYCDMIAKSERKLSELKNQWLAKSMALSQ